MKYLSLLVISSGIMFTSCEKCGHCETQYGDGATACGKPDYENAKKACATGNLGGTPVGTWVDE